MRDLGLAALVGAAGASLASAAPSAERDGLRAAPAIRVLHVTDPAGATGTVQLENTTPAAIEIRAITPRASCASEVTLDAPASFTLGPGASRALTIACSGAIHAGMKRCTFDVHRADGRVLQVEGVCEGGTAPELVSDTTTIDLGAVAVGASAGSTHVVTNTSAETITRLAFQTTDPDGNFEIGAPCTMDARACDASAGDLGPGASTAFTVLCRPKSAGPKTAELYIASDTGTFLAGPIALACDGTPATSPVLAMTGTPVDGGAVEVGTTETSAAVLRLRNAGAGPLKLTSVTLASGAPDWGYTARGACEGPPGSGALEPGCELAPGAEATLTLAFAPLEIGVRTGTLLIDFEDTAARQLAIPLTGRGLGGTVARVDAPSLLDFGRVPLGATSQLTFRLANAGNQVLTDVTVATVPTGRPFDLLEPSPLALSPTNDTLVTATCTPSVPGLDWTSIEVRSLTARDSSQLAIDATCEGSDEALYSAPTAIALGAVRTQTTPAPISLELHSATPRTISEISLETPSTQLTLSGPTGPTPLAIELAVAPTSDGDLRNAILVRSSDGDELRIPISGEVVTPAHSAPPAHSLGTFCVGQPTTPGTLALRSTGSGAFRIGAPAMMAAVSSPFDVEPVAPTVFPAFVPPSGRAVVHVTPRRQSAPGVVQDVLVWTTDIEGAPTATTSISASFLSDGGAIAPTAVDFGRVPVHGSSEPRTITLQNCDRTPIRLEVPQLRAPFTIERGTFPMLLEPNEVETIAVGFRPAQSGVYAQTMTIPSMQLGQPLEVTLLGEASSAGSVDEVIEESVDDERSFYGCAGCTTQDPGGALAVVVAAGVAIGTRRRRRSVSARCPSGSS